MGSSAKQSQTQSQSTTQTDNRIGAADSGVVAQGGSVVLRDGSQQTNLGAGASVTTTYNSLDPETVAQSLGISRDIARDAANLAGYSVSESSDVSRRALDTNSDVSMAAIASNRDTATAGFELARALAGDNADVVRDSLTRSLNFGSDVAAGGVDIAARALQELGKANNNAISLADSTNTTVSRALESFGTELSKVKEISVSGGLAETNKAIKIAATVAIGAIALGGIYLISSGKKN